MWWSVITAVYLYEGGRATSRPSPRNWAQEGGGMCVNGRGSGAAWERQAKGVREGMGGCVEGTEVGEGMHATHRSSGVW